MLNFIFSLANSAIKSRLAQHEIAFVLRGQCGIVVGLAKYHEDIKGKHIFDEILRFAEACYMVSSVCREESAGGISRARGVPSLPPTRMILKFTLL